MAMKMLRKWFVLVLLACTGSAMAQVPVNINTADQNELLALTGIGPSRAEAIVNYRQDNGPFLQIDDLAKVRGIGQKTVDANRTRITVGSDTLSSSGS